MNWFMSYVYHHRGFEGKFHFGSTVTRGEHPIAKVMRWNSKFEDRRIVLLNFQPISQEDADRFKDCDTEI